MSSGAHSARVQRCPQRPAAQPGVRGGPGLGGLLCAAGGSARPSPPHHLQTQRRVQAPVGAAWRTASLPAGLSGGQTAADRGWGRWRQWLPRAHSDSAPTPEPRPPPPASRGFHSHAAQSASRARSRPWEAASHPTGGPGGEARFLRVDSPGAPSSGGRHPTPAPRVGGRHSGLS